MAGAVCGRVLGGLEAQCSWLCRPAWTEEIWWAGVLAVRCICCWWVLGEVLLENSDGARLEVGWTSVSTRRNCQARSGGELCTGLWSQRACSKARLPTGSAQQRMRPASSLSRGFAQGCGAQSPPPGPRRSPLKARPVTDPSQDLLQRKARSRVRRE